MVRFDLLDAAVTFTKLGVTKSGIDRIGSIILMKILTSITALVHISHRPIAMPGKLPRKRGLVFN